MAVFVQHLCLYLKRWVVEHAHPAPHRIDVDPGKDGTIQHAIVMKTLSQTFERIEGMRVEMDTASDGMSDDDTVHEASMWLDGESGIVVSGCFTICRYAGKLARLYPICPFSAAFVDEWLERLQHWTRDVEDGTDLLPYVVAIIQRMESSMEDTDFLAGLASMSIADVCWSGAFEWLKKHHPQIIKEIEWDDFPNVEMWVCTMTHIFEEEDDGDEAQEYDKDDETKKEE